MHVPSQMPENGHSQEQAPSMTPHAGLGRSTGEVADLHVLGYQLIAAVTPAPAPSLRSWGCSASSYRRT